MLNNGNKDYRNSDGDDGDKYNIDSDDDNDDGDDWDTECLVPYPGVEGGRLHSDSIYFLCMVIMLTVHLICVLVVGSSVTVYDVIMKLACSVYHQSVFFRLQIISAKMAVNHVNLNVLGLIPWINM